ncbi:hypothetical protein ACS0ZK_39370, partial [Burkholderia gladioli]
MARSGASAMHEEGTADTAARTVCRIGEWQRETGLASVDQADMSWEGRQLLASKTSAPKVGIRDSREPGEAASSPAGRASCGFLCRA